MVVLRGDLIKCVVLGDDNVGKTSMLMCYATNRFPSQHVPNVFDNYAGSVVLSGKQYTLQMIDTTEQEDTDEARRQSYSGADVFIVCFSVVKPETLRNVKRRWIPEIRDLMGETPIILIGTQTDLRDDETVLNKLKAKGEKPISARDATVVSRHIGAACYMESSPVMKKRMKRVVNDAFVSVFCRKEDHQSFGCTIV
ncbi:cell division control protein 42 homolog [Mercenaria mercenaria]|uniref:cell division control protein 42 homolog n=1 Tax=Mercenaria mercenaria TaxID=6596 RepID=UPI00234F1C1A|nr:cell division control protein 42 homolog [Mercenaria mercenaria]